MLARLRFSASTVLFGGILLLAPNLVTAQGAAGANPDVPLLVQETAVELEAAGCERVPVNDRERLMAVKALGWSFVVTSDAREPALMACQANVINTLQAQTGGGAGQVAGVANAQSIQNPNPIPQQAAPAEGGGSTGSGLFGKVLEVVLNIVSFVIDGIFSITKLFLTKLIALMSHLIIGMLSFNTFVTHGVVTKFWPMTLGIANLGFMLALVTIALFTTLNIEVGGGARRLLPRLFIGAIFVNFSLVIGGLILDITKIIMAIIPIATEQGSLADLAKKIELALNLPGISIEMFKWVEDDRAMAHIMQALIAVAVLWVVVIAMGVMVFGLIVRYIMLIGLLIVSPFAYLFMGFPGLSGLSRRWWTAFLKYAFFGPIALFFLLAGIFAANTHSLRPVLGGEESSAQRAGAVVFDMLILAGFMYAGATAGKYAGMVGAAAAVSVATRQGRRGAGTYLRGTQYAGGKAAQGAYVLSGARKLDRSARAGIRGAFAPVRRGLKMGEFSQYDARGGLKPGESTRLSRLGERVGMKREDKKAASAIRSSNQAATSKGYNATTDKNLTAANLSRGAVAPYMSGKLIEAIHKTGTPDQQTALRGAVGTTNRLNSEQIQAVIDTGDHDLMRSVVNNVNIVASSSGGDKSKLINAAAASGQKDLVDTLFRTIDRAKRAQEK